MNKWKLKDVILMAILGEVFAAIYLAGFNGGMVISTALTPLGLSAFGFELIYGVWFMAATLAAYIIRKPGVALLTEILASVVELLMGNSGGLTVVLTGFIQGLGAEVIFACFRYKKWNLLSMSLASMLSALFIFCYELYYQAGRRRAGQDRRGQELRHRQRGQGRARIHRGRLIF